MICVIHKIAVLLKITRILKTLFKEYESFIFFKKIVIFRITCNDRKFNA